MDFMIDTLNLEKLTGVTNYSFNVRTRDTVKVKHPMLGKYIRILTASEPTNVSIDWSDNGYYYNFTKMKINGLYNQLKRLKKSHPLTNIFKD